MRTLNLPGVYGAKIPYAGKEKGVSPTWGTSPGEMKQLASDIARDGAILALWGERKDTRDIASALNMRESDVANRLAWLRDQQKGK